MDTRDLKNIDISSFNNNKAECLELIREHWNKIPLLNVVSSQHLGENKLVRFKGMIQDMFNPEYYYETCEVINKETKEKHIIKGKYKDTPGCSTQEYIHFESEANITKERQTFVLITAPGINGWEYKSEEEKSQHHNNTGVFIPPTYSKRKIVDGCDNEMNSSTMEVETTETNLKKNCTETNSSENGRSSFVSVDHLLNMPLPDRPGKACHLKVYENANNLKLNELVDCVGFLSMERLYSEGSENCDNDNIDESAMEIQTHHPPPSLIPKIHCVAFKPIVDCSSLYEESANMSEQELQNVRKEFEIIFTQLLLGDRLAAEYLILHLISKVYSRMELMALGKFAYNISNVPDVLPHFGIKVYGFLENILSKSHYLPMTLDNMNDLSFIPKKDYDCNRITSGILQLSNNTHLVLDETKLSVGQMNSNGVQAIGAISNIIKNQRFHYDFNYYKMDFDCDIAILVFSEGKSLLPSDFHVVLNPEDGHVSTFDEIVSALNVYLKPELLRSIRKYIVNRRHAEYQISDNIHELVQNEFVKMRASQNMTAEDLHSLLVLARSVCLAEGKTVLDEFCWKRACDLEQERKARIEK